MASHVDTTTCRIEERVGEDDRLAHAGAEREVQLSDEREPYKCAVGDPPSNPTPLADDVWYRVLG